MKKKKKKITSKNDTLREKIGFTAFFERIQKYFYTAHVDTRTI